MEFFLKNMFPVFILILFHSCWVSGEVFQISIDRTDTDLKEKISFLNILSTSFSSDGQLVYVVNATSSDMSQFNGAADIKAMPGQIIEVEYPTLDELNLRMEKAVDNSKGYAEIYSIGESVEKRTIKAVRLTKSDTLNNETPEVLFVGLHHAREWISSEVTIGIMEFLINNSDSNPFVSDILSNSVIWFVPMLNPDGYLFSMEYNRMWRRNRRINPDESIGVDLNRNYDASWIPYEYYHGTEPFSEPETMAIKNLILNDFEKPMDNGIQSLDGLLTYHSYGQLIMYPPGSTDEPAEKHVYYRQLAEKMSSLVFSECGSNYLVMQNSELYYTFGEMTEWFMKTHAGKPSFTIELRPHGGSEYFFELPAEQINDTVKENIAPALYFIRHLISGEINISMDINGNGINDVVEKTFFDYPCDRSDLFEPDDETEPDDEYDEHDDENHKNDSDLEKNEADEVTDAVIETTDKGCNLLYIERF